MMIEETRAKSPIGDVWWAARGGAVVALGFDVQVASLRARVAARFAGEPWETRAGRVAGGVERALEAYFAGELDALASVAIDPAGTPFQARVWSALRAIPSGRTTSYAALAVAVAAPRGARAVGGANGENPISLVLPCHRVIGRSGALSGYAGGVARKRWLLAHEGALMAPEPPPRKETGARDRAPRAS